ncbi:major vault protein [Paragonimus westermani]|uniref:Major vault protein n=1 Tax=Paragonimus westermani TaxID=34504 RepID=A0A5J4N4V4_9TREM|nr:major vault protein [Paragonimus westermani]
MPGESLERRLQRIHILGLKDGLVLRAVQQIFEESNTTCKDVAPKLRQPGERWLIRGPCEYVPPVGVEVVEKRTAIPLGESEGIYVRNTQTGEVRVVTGTTYMLTEDEEHWEKQLPTSVIELLADEEVRFRNRIHLAEVSYPSPVSACAMIQDYFECEEADEYGESSLILPEEPKPFQVISLQVPHNAAAQINDYRQNKSRVEFGPVLVMLGPHEQFTLLSLSGGKPKRPNVVKSLYLLLGPDFVTDMVVVETADHARLSLQLSYNWIFDTTEAMENPVEADKLFSVPDFNSARTIRVACLGLDESGKVQNSCMFTENRLRITGVDIQAVAPTDERTRELLMKSVQMAIEITTSSLEAAARHEATRLEQEARGRLERQKIMDETEVEKSKRRLLEMQITATALASTGEARAKALAQAESERIKGLSAVEQSASHVEEKRIRMVCECILLQVNERYRNTNDLLSNPRFY